MTFGLDLVARVREKLGRPTRVGFGDVGGPEPQRQRGRDHDQALRRLGHPLDLRREVDRRQEDVATAGLVAGRVGRDRGRVDDVVDPLGNGERAGDPEIAEDEPDFEAFEGMEVGGRPHQTVDLPTPRQEMAAEVRADEAVGPGDEDLHAVVPSPPTAAFHARTSRGATQRTSTAVRMPATLSVT